MTEPLSTPEKAPDRPLTPEEIELEWYHNVYRGDDMVQLTWRAVLMGSVLGGLMSASNMYIGLKTGWGFGVAITACILSYAIWNTLLKVGIARTPMTILENNAMQSTASSAGYSTGGTMVSAIAAYMMLNQENIPYVVLTAWIFFLAVLGVTMAIPMKRQMINMEKLRFPSGIAAAETLKALHSGKEGASSAKALSLGGLSGALIVSVRDSLGWLPETFNIFGPKWAGMTVSMECGLLMYAAGAIMGLRVAASMLGGAVLNYVILVPWAYDIGAIHSLNYQGIVEWSLWGGAACMVTSGLFSFGLKWRTALRAFSGLKTLFKKAVPGSKEDPLERIEVPGSWFAGGMLFGGAGVVYIIWAHFGTPMWQGALAVVLSFFLALVACRATGETDTTPIGAMGKITQLMYGAIAPRQMNTNLMSACITAGVADSASDLLIDLKSGYVLGANPRKQFLAQFSGIFVGTVVAIPVFYLMAPNHTYLGTDRWPAPAAQVWKSVAMLLSEGFGSLHYTARWALLIGALVGILLPMIAALKPKLEPYLPSAMGLGMAFTIPFNICLSMFIGAVIASILLKKKPKLAETYTVPVASGIVAGESLTGILVIMSQML